MGDPLQLDRAERLTAIADALAALERLRDLRELSPNHVPTNPELIELARRPPPSLALDRAEIFDRFVRIAAAGWDKTSGRNFSFIPNGSLDAGTVAALLATGANSFTGAAFEAPAMVAMEEGVLRWMADLFGLPAEAGGLLLSGGSLANQTAIATARARATGTGTGMRTIYASERVHHSVVKAAHLIGIPPEAIRTVGTDPDGRCDVARLRAQMDADSGGGRQPFLIVGVAGSTDTGSVDRLDELADIAEGRGAWFHVDAAYGGFFALTRRGRERLRGIDRADSVTIDAHKGLFLPYGVAALLVRDPSALVEAHEGSGSYLRGIETIGALPDYFRRGPELTRPNRALLIWFALQFHGTAAFAEELDRMLDLAEFAYRRLAAIPGIVVGPAPATSIVTFRASDGNDHTDRVVTALHATGRFQVSTTDLDGHAWIRFAFLSPRTTQAHVVEALDVVAAASAAT